MHMCFYVDYAWAYIPMHTRRSNYGNTTLGMLVNMSMCVNA